MNLDKEQNYILAIRENPVFTLELSMTRAAFDNFCKSFKKAKHDRCLVNIADSFTFVLKDFIYLRVEKKEGWGKAPYTQINLKKEFEFKGEVYPPHVYKDLLTDITVLEGYVKIDEGFFNLSCIHHIQKVLPT